MPDDEGIAAEGARRQSAASVLAEMIRLGGVTRRSFVAAAAAGACLLVSRPSRGEVAPVIRVAASPNSDVAPLWYALSKGMFAKAGLNVDFTQMTTGAVVAQAVAGGAIDIGYSALTALIVGHVRNIPFVLIAPAGMYQTASPIGSMLVRKDSSLATGRDFAGKTIGAPTLLDVSAIVSSAWVDQTGGNSKSLKFVEVPNPLLLPALLDGRIDAFTSVDPWVTRALDSGEVRVLAKSFDSIAPSFLITSWFSNTAFVEKNRDLVERFARVLREAAVDANAHRAEIVSLIASYTKLDPTMIARTLKDSNASYLDPKTIQPMIDILAKYHVIEKGFDARDLISTTALSPGK